MTPALHLDVTSEGHDVRRVALAVGKRYTIGRTSEADVPVQEDHFLSRLHAEVDLNDGRLKVRKVAGAANPIGFQGKERDEFTLEPGQWFVIGKTRFTLVQEGSSTAGFERVSTTPTSESAPQLSHTLNDVELYEVEGHTDRLRLLDLLELPELLRNQPRAEFFVHLAGVLRLATSAKWACVAREDGTVLAKDSGSDMIGEVSLSRSLIQSALKDAPRPTFYVWSSGAGDMMATVQEGADWAICSAIRLPGEPALILYVLGEGIGEPFALKNHSRFVGLVADMVGRSLSVQRLEGWQSRLQRYFSGAIIEKILGSADPKELEPKVTDSTVMFFDLRGFSKRTEGQNEKIVSYLAELKKIMTTMTEEIFKENGVVISYMGDGILACWNVPVPDSKHVDQACRSALRMIEALRTLPGNWNCGIGLHTGQVVAGAIGSEQVFSYGLMGTVVNQASRVEGITKAVETPILVTKEVADRVSADVAVPMRIGRFQPAGMGVALDLYELAPPPANAARITPFTEGLKAFEAGDWERAYGLLDPLGANDRPARYLKLLADSYRRRPPREWRGVIDLVEK